MKTLITICSVVLIVSTTTVFAGTNGIISTDRFGYAGSTTRYATLEDAQNGTNALGTTTIMDRDLGLYLVNNYPGYSSNDTEILGSWWYTTYDNTNGYQKDDPAGDLLYSGWGNTHGNTGIGFLQIYDIGNSTVTSESMSFSNFDGTYWTQFNLSVSGSNADYDNSYARFSPFESNTQDKALYYSYALTLSATGLQGIESSPGVIAATNHPTGVTGTLTGLAENKGTDPTKQGFYTFDITLNMTNWAFSQGDEALNGDFSDSYFAVVPEPATIGLLGLGALSLLRKRNKK